MEQASKIDRIDLLKELVKDKCSLKQDVYDQTLEGFKAMKLVIKETVDALEGAVCGLDERVVVKYSEQGNFEAVATIGGDAVVFHMHSNVFTFPNQHMIHKSPFIQRNDKGAYFGVINIYNFLSDSFRYHRLKDLGYLIARVFINKDGHFFVEGKGQLSYQFNDISAQTVSQEHFKAVIETALVYVMNFDLYTPPYQAVQEISLLQVMELNTNMKMQTAKRLGFRFESEQNVR